jgi:preprotein translocase subunit SecF
MQLFTKTDYNFTGMMKWAVMLSALVIAAGFVSLGVNSLNWGIDFIGGTLLHAKYSHAPEVEDIRSQLSAIGQSHAHIQKLGGGTKGEILIRVEKSEEESEEAVAGSLRMSLYSEGERAQIDAGKFDLNVIGKDPLASELYTDDPLSLGQTELARTTYDELATAIKEHRKHHGPMTDFAQMDEALSGSVSDWEKVRTYLAEKSFLGGFMVVAQESVGPSVGKELREKAYLAIGIALFGILVYITFRFQFVYGLAAIVAVFHDVLITVGLFSLFQREFNLPIIAALLTIVGYSLNDTIVVFDRIRDNLRIMRREKFGAIINRSINQTLSRTLLTSGTTLTVILALYFLGGSVINGFAFALLAGVLVGTYSSIFVASALLVLWNSLKEARLKKTGAVKA